MASPHTLLCFCTVLLVLLATDVSIAVDVHQESGTIPDSSYIGCSTANVIANYSPPHDWSTKPDINYQDALTFVNDGVATICFQKSVSIALDLISQLPPYSRMAATMATPQNLYTYTPPKHAS